MRNMQKVQFTAGALVVAAGVFAANHLPAAPLTYQALDQTVAQPVVPTATPVVTAQPSIVRSAPKPYLTRIVTTPIPLPQLQTYTFRPPTFTPPVYPALGTTCHAVFVPNVSYIGDTVQVCN